MVSSLALYSILVFINRLSLLSIINAITLGLKLKKKKLVRGPLVKIFVFFYQKQHIMLRLLF